MSTTGTPNTHELWVYFPECKQYPDYSATNPPKRVPCTFDQHNPASPCRFCTDDNQGHNGNETVYNHDPEAKCGHGHTGSCGFVAKTATYDDVRQVRVAPWGNAPLKVSNFDGSVRYMTQEEWAAGGQGAGQAGPSGTSGGSGGGSGSGSGSKKEKEKKKDKGKDKGKEKEKEKKRR